MRTQVECIVFRRTKEVEFLLLKRIKKKGGFWQPPCGGVEEQDASLLDAAFRELAEETGIERENVVAVIEGVYEFTMDKHYLTGEPMTPITEYVFGFEVDPSVTVALGQNVIEEHEEYRWVPFDEALRLLKWEDNKEAFRELNELLQRNAP